MMLDLTRRRGLLTTCVTRGVVHAGAQKRCISDNRPHQVAETSAVYITMDSHNRCICNTLSPWISSLPSNQTKPNQAHTPCYAMQCIPKTQPAPPTKIYKTGYHSQYSTKHPTTAHATSPQKAKICQSSQHSKSPRRRDPGSERTDELSDGGRER